MIELWHLTNINWLRELPAAAAEALRQSADLIAFAKGALIFSPDPDPEYVFILDAGLVRIYRESSNAQEVTFGYIHPGEVFGELAAFSDRPRESYAVAVEPSRAFKIPVQAFVQAIQTRSSIVFSITTQIEGRFKHIESQIEDLVFLPARGRLARILLRLADEFGEPHPNGRIIQLRLTHAELATLIGTSRPTASIALGELEDDNVISRDDGGIVITDALALRRDAASGIDTKPVAN